MTPTRSALSLWRVRLNAGTLGERPDAPATWKLDVLWSAACLEAQATHARRAGLITIAEDWERRAADLLRTGGTHAR